MEQLLNPRVRAIAISGIRRFFNKVAQYPDAISLTIGQPDFPTPAHVKTAGQRAIAEDRTVYTHNAGLFELRQAAARFVARYGLTYDAADEVIVTTGASQALDITLRTVLAEGDEVVLPAPVYPGYAPLIEMQGARPVYIDTRASSFCLTADDLERHLTDRTKCVILPYPSNPTGTVLTREELRRIAAVLCDRPVFVISDEVYSELVYDGAHASIAAEPGMRERTIVINALSKSHSMTGWRMGFAFAPREIAEHMLKVQQYSVTCASSVSQYAALEALTNGTDDAAPMRAEYQQRRDYTCDRLAGMGLHCPRPGGAFYVFPSIAHTGMSSLDFATRLLEQARVAVVPGDAFSAYGEGYIRISYACDRATLREALDRMEQFLRG